MSPGVVQGCFSSGALRKSAARSTAAIHRAPIQFQRTARIPGPPTQVGPPAVVAQAREALSAGPRARDAFAIDPARIGLVKGGGAPLPESVRSRMEAALGADFSTVRVHVGPQAERIGAIAFTVGSDIYFAPGRYRPGTSGGEQLLGHELAHVLQQRDGRVRNPTGAGIALVRDRGLEAEADRMGRRVGQAKMSRGAGGHRSGRPLAVAAALGGRIAVAQRMEEGNVPSKPFTSSQSGQSFDPEPPPLLRRQARRPDRNGCRETEVVPRKPLSTENICQER